MPIGLFIYDLEPIIKKHGEDQTLRFAKRLGPEPQISVREICGKRYLTWVTGTPAGPSYYGQDELWKNLPEKERKRLVQMRSELSSQQIDHWRLVDYDEHLPRNYYPGAT